MAYQENETDEWKEGFQSRFDRLSEQPPKDSDNSEHMTDMSAWTVE